MQERQMRSAAAASLRLLPALLIAAGAGRLAAQDSTHHDPGGDPNRPVADGGSVPAGWSVRTDAKAPLTDVRVVPMGGGIHVTLGPAIILYRGRHVGKGPFHTLATFTQTKPTRHPEGACSTAARRSTAGPRGTPTSWSARTGPTW
jgi:hypothetical protein